MIYSFDKLPEIQKNLPIVDGLNISDFESSRCPFEVNTKELLFTTLNKADIEILKHFKIDPEKKTPEQLLPFHFPSQVYVLVIPDNTVLKDPVILKYKSNTDNLAYGLLIHVGDNSKINIIEDFTEHVQSNHVYYYNQNYIGQNSEVVFASLQNTTANVSLNESRLFNGASGSNTDFFSCHFGGRKINSNISQTSTGEHAELNTNLIVRARENQEFNFVCDNSYLRRNGKGTVITKGIALDKSKIKIDGILNINEGGMGTDAHLSQKILNLSPNSKVDVTPILKIKTNDVKTGHSASIKNVDPEEMFYLEGRSLNPEEARKTLINGFLKEELDKINYLPGIKTWIEKVL